MERVLIHMAKGEGAEDNLPGKPLAALFWAYSLSLHKVPKNGELAQVYVFCTDFSAHSSSYGMVIRLTRPALGDTYWLTLKR